MCNNNVLKRGNEIIGHVPRLRAVQRSWHLQKTTDNTEFDKHRSRIEAAQNCAMKYIVAAASDRANTVC